MNTLSLQVVFYTAICRTKVNKSTLKLLVEATGTVSCLTINKSAENESEN